MFDSPSPIPYLKFILIPIAIFIGAFLAADDSARYYLISGAFMGLTIMFKFFPLFFAFVITLLLGILAVRK